jgi:hypothetical protein
MEIRYVTRTGKDKDGDITKLCNPGQPWSPRYKADAIRDIDNFKYEYRVEWPANRLNALLFDQAGQPSEATICVVNDPYKGKYLRTDHDSTTRNNLDDLPDC